VLWQAVPAASQEATTMQLQPNHLSYLGAFAFPVGDHWAYSGHALAFDPNGDPGGDGDGFSGSLFAAGFEVDRLVGEISIPAPIVSDDFADITRASVLQTQADITGGWIDNCTWDDECMYREVAGLELLPVNGMIAWNLRDWYNVDGGDQDSLGWSLPDMTGAAGVWHIGGRTDTAFHNAKTCDYLFTAPLPFAERHLGGRSLIAGNHRPAGAFGGSQGPTLVAVAPWLDGSPPLPGQELDALALLYYRENLECTDNDFEECDYPGYRVADEWGGGAWIEAGSLGAVLVFGLKGLGDNCYGTPGQDCPPSLCSPYKGWHSSPYEPQILFYDPDDLVAVVEGDSQPWEVEPSRIHRPTDVVFEPDCARLGAASYDRQRRLLYVAERIAGPWGATAVHVWEVTALFGDDFERGDASFWTSMIGE
jgi:hypothetical protein